MKFRSVLPICLLMLAFTSASFAASKEEIDAKVHEALDNFYKTSAAGKQLSEKAHAILVFPSIVKAGFIVGGEYGEGALLTNGNTEAYYNIISASFGYQLGAQMHSQVVLFMTQEALERFRYSNGWDAGFGGSIAVVTAGASKEFTIDNVQEPVIAFIFSEKGLMGNLSLEGSKVSKINK
jgi:lipid-binding SYLF domain-containing protein